MPLLELAAKQFASTILITNDTRFTYSVSTGTIHMKQALKLREVRALKTLRKQMQGFDLATNHMYDIVTGLEP